MSNPIIAAVDEICEIIGIHQRFWFRIVVQYVLGGANFKNENALTFTHSLYLLNILLA